MKSKIIVLVFIAIVISLGILTRAVLSDPISCTIDNTTTPWNMTCNDNLNTTRINNYFNMDCTNVTATLTNNLSICMNTSANLTAQIQALQNAMTGNYNYTRELIDCREGQSSCNTQLQITSEDLVEKESEISEYKNKSEACTAELSKQGTAYQSQLSAKDTQCNTDKANLQKEFDGTLNNYYIYIVVAFIAGYFIISKIREKQSGAKKVDDRTGPNPSERFA